MSDIAIRLSSVGKMYKLYRRQSDRVLDVFGVGRLLPGRRNRYREFWALRGLELEIPRGQRLGIIGRNGSGKSTMLKLIAGNAQATEGRLMVRGSVQALMELGTGFHPEFTGRQNIRASLAYHGFSSGLTQVKEDEIIDFAELEEFIEQPVKTYSAGMYARLAFSTATAIEPEVLIIDEILGAGDAYFAGKCVERMRRLTDQSGATVLFVSHDLGSVQQLCERVIWIDRGRIVMDDSPLNVTKAYYASILQQDEARLRARNARLSRRQAGEIVAHEHDNGMHEVLLRLIARPDGPPRASHPVRRLVLSAGAGYRGEVEPGGPMDNDPSQPAHILSDRAFMNWSEPTLVRGVRVRCFQDEGGRYLHAPFVFAVPREAWARKQFHLTIEHAAGEGEEVGVDLFDGREYRSLGRLSPSPKEWRSEEFDLPRETSLAESLEEPSIAMGPEPTNGESAFSTGAQDKWANSEAKFEEIVPISGAGEKKQVFSLGEPIGFRITAAIQKDLATCWLVIVVYDGKGNVVHLVKHRFGGLIRAGRVTWDLIHDHSNLRQGEYVATVELLPAFDEMAIEKMPHYCHWNRCIMFRVNEGYLGHVPLGLVELPYRLEEHRTDASA